MQGSEPHASLELGPPRQREGGSDNVRGDKPEKRDVCIMLLERYETILHRLGAELLAHYGGRLVTCAVFGSVGRGTARHGSDVDLLLIVRNLPSGRMRRREEFLPVEDRLGPLLATCAGADGLPTLSPVLKAPDEVRSGSPLFPDMVEDARILFDEGGGLRGLPRSPPVEAPPARRPTHPPRVTPGTGC